MVLNIKKLAVAGAIAGIALTLSSGRVLAAADATAHVEDDGDSFSLTSDSDEFEVDNDQHASLSNFDLGIGVSGANSQSDSDDENEMGTGEAAGWGSSDNFLNSNVTAIEDVEDDSATSEATTGEDGSAEALAFDNDYIKVDNDNHAYLENLTLGLAVSGLNSQDGNDDGNTMTTGDSEAMAFALNEVNSNWTVIGGGHSAHASAEVGDDGDSFALAKDNDEVRVYNDNEAKVENASLAFAISGGNSQSWNDDDNSIETGESSAQSSATNFVNSNVTVVGSQDGGATASATTGEDGSAESKAFDNDEVKVDNDNSAYVENVSVAAGVSGGNTQDGNDDNNSITTGSASGGSCSTNTVNSNWTVIGGELPEGGSAGCGE